MVPEEDDLQGVMSAKVSAAAPSHLDDGHGDRPRRPALHVKALLGAVDHVQILNACVPLSALKACDCVCVCVLNVCVFCAGKCGVKRLNIRQLARRGLTDGNSHAANSRHTLTPPQPHGTNASRNNLMARPCVRKQDGSSERALCLHEGIPLHEAPYTLHAVPPPRMDGAEVAVCVACSLAGPCLSAWRLLRGCQSVLSECVPALANTCVCSVCASICQRGSICQRVRAAEVQMGCDAGKRSGKRPQARNPAHLGTSFFPSLSGR